MLILILLLLLYISFDCRYGRIWVNSINLEMRFSPSFFGRCFSSFLELYSADFFGSRTQNLDMVITAPCFLNGVIPNIFFTRECCCVFVSYLWTWYLNRNCHIMFFYFVLEFWYIHNGVDRNGFSWASLSLSLSTPHTREKKC